MYKLLYRGIPLLIFTALVLLLWRGLSLDPTALPSVLIDKPMPAFTVPRLDDSHTFLSHDDLLDKIFVS